MGGGGGGRKEWDRHLLGKQWRLSKYSESSSENSMDLLFFTYGNIIFYHFGYTFISPLAIK